MNDLEESSSEEENPDTDEISNLSFVNDLEESSEKEENPEVVLKTLRNKNLRRIIIGHLNINSLTYKFESLKAIVQDNIDILLISETKIDDSFPMNEFSIDGYNTPIRLCPPIGPIRLDRNNNGGGIILYTRADIPFKKINNTLSSDIEGLFYEIKLRNKKWLLFLGYNPDKANISYFLNHAGRNIDSLIGLYDNIMVIGDFNSQMEETSLKEFCDTYNLENLIKEPTCFKNPCNPTLIDMFLTNRVNFFKNSSVIETGISDYHKMTITVLKT